MHTKVKRNDYSAATFYEAPQTIGSGGLAGAQKSIVLDWRAVRAELRRLRDVNDLTREELQKLSGVEKTTIYRIENTKELPDYKPDFDTIDALLTAMDITLSGFFARIEGLPPTPQTDPESPTNSHNLGAEHGRALSSAERSADTFVQRTFIAALAQEIAIAVDRLIDARAKTRTARKTTSAATRRSRKTRQSAAR